jgi:two-component system, chemotaxis family, chemotaxis protein CheY
MSSSDYPTVLIVDDLAFVRKSLTEIFNAHHFRVIGEAADGHSAIKQYATLKPDLVTMDMVMPTMSGLEATKAIVDEFPEAKIIIISALAQEQVVMEAVAAGAKDYIVKPFKVEDVIKTARHVLSSNKPLRAANL